MMKKIKTDAYSKIALPHLKRVLTKNSKTMKSIATSIVSGVKAGKSLFVFGSGHSGLVPLELFHRAGGASFIVPITYEKLLPSAGPAVVREFERTPQAANFLLDQSSIRAGEMLWIFSQSGINSSVVDFALVAKSRGIRTVAFTSTVHSKKVPARHSSGRKLFQVCDQTIDLGGVVGDASVQLSKTLSAGPLSNLTGTFLAHSILVAAVTELEKSGHPCVYTSVNTPEGESRNRELESAARKRDPLMRESK
jgi:uncharacterized phosphosugar-binding protein